MTDSGINRLSKIIQRGIASYMYTQHYTSASVSELPFGQIVEVLEIVVQQPMLPRAAIIRKKDK
jgi:hypothetical protein